MIINYKTIAFACLVGVLLTGCKTDNIVETSVLMPANNIKDVKKLNPIAIYIDAKISGNLSGKRESEIISNDIRQRVISSISNEGIYKTVDAIWADENGPVELQKFMQAKNTPHGYDLIHSPSIKSSRMEIKLNSKISLQKQVKENKVKLKQTNYTTEYKNGIPYAKKGKTRVKKELQIPTVTYKTICNGSMEVKIYDIYNKLVYKKSFPSLAAESMAGVKQETIASLGNIISIPGKHTIMPQLPQSVLIGKMIEPAISELVKDISPHRVTSKIRINESGDNKSVVLLKAHAFTEAVERLDEILSKNNQRTIANYENMAIGLEVLGEYFMAQSYWEKALELDSSNQRLRSGLERAKNIVDGQSKL